MRLRAKPTAQTYVMAAVLDGVAGRPGHPGGVEIALRPRDGYLLAFETGWIRGAGDDAPTPPGKFGVGGWMYTARFDDLAEHDANGSPRQQRGNFGVYLHGEHQLFHEGDDVAQGLSIFGRGGVAEDQFNPFGAFVGGGLAYTGLFPTRDTDQLGLAFASALAGRGFMRATRAAGGHPASNETAIELTYRCHVTPWFYLQPDVQYVLAPGASRSIADALAIALRFQVTF